MNITLRPEQKKWLEAQVSAGQFTSIEEAVSIAIADLIALHSDDLAWAKPYVDEARASAARGDVLSKEVFFERLTARIATLRSS